MNRNKKRQIILSAVSGILIVTIITVGSILIRKQASDYFRILHANWNIELPSDLHFSEIYVRQSDSNFLGDGIRYHIYTYTESEQMPRSFEWQTEQQRTNYSDSYSEAVTAWLNEIGVPADKRPIFSDCMYFYQTKTGGDELLILWDQSAKKIYIAEFFL